MRFKPFSLLVAIALFPIAAFSQVKDVKYRRSSLSTMMINDESRQHAVAIKKAFLSAPIPEKFNDHNLANRVIQSSNSKDESANISSYLSKNEVAKKMVAKWFNRSERGEFDMSLISQRGLYDASAMDASVASASKRGSAMLADAGEELIKNTFVVVNDYSYLNKEDVAGGAAVGFLFLGSIAEAFGFQYGQELGAVAAGGAIVAGKGYVVKTTSYLYQLDWNDSVAAVFYNYHWTDAQSFDENKKRAFDSDGSTYRLKFIGMNVAWADVQSTIFTTKTEEELISMATIEAVDAVIAKLQKKYEVFRTKTPLYSVDPLAAKIGLKEGLTKKSKYEVLEQSIDENGRTQYNKIGMIKVDKTQIWDNRYSMTEVAKKSDGIDRTVFKKKSGGDFYPGVLIKQKK